MLSAYCLFVLVVASGSQVQPQEEFLCDACHDTVGALRDAVECEGCFMDFVDVVAFTICRFVEKEDVCWNLVKWYVHVAVNAVYQRYVNPDIICAQVGACSSPQLRYGNFTQWAEDLLADKPPTTKPKRSSSAPLRVGQVSDIHLDIKYANGSNTNCGEPLCCRESFGPGDAGYWGTYGCDIPVRTMDAGLESLAEKDLDFLLWTGDEPPHDLWNQNQTTHKNVLKIVTDAIDSTFTPRNITIYPVLGNHGCFPPNFYLFGYEAWLTDYLADLWSKWLPAKSIAQLRKNGSYSVMHGDSNLKLLVLNTEACYIFNWYLWQNVTDPGEQLEWMISELRESEANGEVVYIVGHIPPGNNNCLNGWSERFNAIIDRFEGIIRGQFYGHTHDDHLIVNSQTFNPTNYTGIQFIAPSLTTYSDQNPSHRVYLADAESFEILDYEQYRTDLPKANLNVTVPPEFPLAYSFLSEYDLPELTPAVVHEWATKMASNETECLTYANNKQTNPANDVMKTCDEACRLAETCAIRNPTYAERMQCEGKDEEILIRIFNFFVGPWLYLDYN